LLLWRLGEDHGLMLARLVVETRDGDQCGGRASTNKFVEL
jgi:hypothetical protein